MNHSFPSFTASLQWPCALSLAAVLLLAGCDRGADNRSDAEPLATPTMTDGTQTLAHSNIKDPITIGWYLDRKKLFTAAVIPPYSDATETYFVAGELNDFLRDYALALEARAAGLSDDATHQAWEQTRREEMARNLQKRRWLDQYVPTVSHTEIVRHYEANKDRYFRPRSFSWKVISADKEKRGAEGALKRIQEAKAMLDAGRPFEDVIELMSDADPRHRGKVRGPYVEGELPQIKVENAAKSTAVGAYTDILDLPYEYQILKIETKREPSYRPLDEVYAELRYELVTRNTEAARKKYLDEYVKRGELRLFPEHMQRADSPAGLEVAVIDSPAVDGDEIAYFVSDLNEWAAAGGVTAAEDRQRLVYERVFEDLLRREPSFTEALNDPEIDYLLSLESEPKLAQRMVEARILALTSVPLSEEQLRAEYDSNPERYAMQEQRAVYALYTYAELKDNMYQYEKLQAMAHAKSRSDWIRSQIADGLGFIHAVRAHSHGDRSKDGYLGLCKRGDLPPLIDGPAFTIGLCEVSNSIQFGNGYALLWVPAIQRRTIPPFEQVRGLVEAAIRYAMREDALARFWKEYEEKIELQLNAAAARAALAEVRYRLQFDSSGATWPLLDGPSSRAAVKRDRG